MQFSKHSSVPGGLAELRRAWLLGWWRAGCEWAIAGPVTRQSKSWPEIEINMIMLTMRMILWRRIHSNTTKIHGIIRQTWWNLANFNKLPWLGCLNYSLVLSKVLYIFCFSLFTGHAGSCGWPAHPKFAQQSYAVEHGAVCIERMKLLLTLSNFKKKGEPVAVSQYIAVIWHSGDFP